MIPLAIQTVSPSCHSSVPHSIHLPQASYLSYTEKKAIKGNLNIFYIELVA